MTCSYLNETSARKAYNMYMQQNNLLNLRTIRMDPVCALGPARIRSCGQDAHERTHRQLVHGEL